jgi:ParB-like chromosome segregation protein Spo0J
VDVSKITHEIVNELLPAAKNPKDHDVGSIMESIRRFGFTAPLIINEATGRLLTGHGRGEALLRMWNDGDDPPRGVTVDKATGQWRVPVVRGVSIEDEREAEAYLIADNRLTEAGGWNTNNLAAMLSSLAIDGVSFDGIGFDTDDLDRMLDDLNSQPQAGSGDSADGAATPKAIKYGVVIDCQSVDEESDIMADVEAIGLNGHRLSRN